MVHHRWPQGRLRFDLADQGLHGQPRAGVRRALARRAQVHGRGVPRTRHDLQRAAARSRAPDHGGVGRNQGYPRPRNFHGRFPAHDGQGHVHDQRRRARDREPARPLAGRLLLRGRGHQQPPNLQRDDHPEPRRLDRVRDRQRDEERRDRGHDRRPDRQEPQDLRDDVRARALAPRPGLRLGERRSDPGLVRQQPADRELPRKRQGHQDQGRRAQGDLQEAPPGRARERGERREAARVAVLRREALRSRPASAATSSTASSKARPIRSCASTRRPGCARPRSTSAR